MNKKLKLGLLGSLLTTSALVVTLPIVSFSSTGSYTATNNVENVLLYKVFNNKIAEDKTMEILVEEMKSLLSFEAQQDLAKQWKEGTELSEAQSKGIIDNLYFTDLDKNEYKGVDVIESLVFASETTINKIIEVQGDSILVKVEMFSPKIKVNFKSGYKPRRDVILNIPNFELYRIDINL
ncbi:MAG: hypothetical protein ACRDCF_02140 [Mycoplasmoidaceae bacterium]